MTVCAAPLTRQSQVVPWPDAARMACTAFLLFSFFFMLWATNIGRRYHNQQMRLKGMKGAKFAAAAGVMQARRVDDRYMDGTAV